MTKIIVQITKIIITIVSLILFSSCAFISDGDGNRYSYRNVKGNSDVVTEKRNIKNGFNYVSGGSGLEITIEQSEETSITVEADENLQKHIITEIKGRELVIYTDVNIKNASAKKIMIRMPEIKGISSSSSASITTKKSIKATTLNLSSSSGSEMNVTVNADNITCDASSGAALLVYGNTRDLMTESSSGGTVNAKGLTAENVQADASSGGSTVVNPTQNLKAEASSGGSVKYINTPKNVSKESSSGGSIYKG